MSYLYADFGGTKFAFMCEKDIEDILKKLKFKILEKLQFKNFTIIKTKSKKFKDIAFEELAKFFKFILIGSAGIITYKPNNIEIFSYNLGKTSLPSDKFFAINDVKAFAYYWGTKYNSVYTLQIGTGINGHFYYSCLINDLDFLKASAELGEININKSIINIIKLINNQKEFNKNLFEILKNLAYAIPFENIVIGGGLAKLVDKEFILYKRKEEKILNLLRPIKEIKIIKEKDYLYNLLGLLKIKENFSNLRHLNN